MKRSRMITAALCVSIMLFSAATVLAQEKASTEEQMESLIANCAKSSEARAARHEEKSLYLRLGGYDKIHALTKEIVRLHEINPEIKHLVVNVDGDRLAKQVADFFAAGTGGDEKYSGRSMPDSHRHLNLTDAHFLAAGSDIVKAMNNLGYEKNEIDEVLCILVSLKDQVVFN